MSNPAPAAVLPLNAAPAVLAESKNRTAFWIGALAFIAFAFKLAIALNTIGTTDTVLFYGFSRALTVHGLEWTYNHSSYFNHPPLIAHFLQAISYFDHQAWCQNVGLAFPFWLRLPGILADLVSVFLLLRISVDSEWSRIPPWALGLFAISPVSIMVSGFHGNTDPLMVMLLLAAAVTSLKERPILCGFLFALSCQVKIVPLLFSPVFFFFWFSRRKSVAFLVPFIITSCVLAWDALLKFPVPFCRNVFSYGSFWGLWGITYLLRLTGFESFKEVTFYNLPRWELLVVTFLKIVIIVSVFVFAWRRRTLGGFGLFHSIAYSWIIFFILSPGIGTQYMVWLAPFILILSPTLYGFLLGSSSVFLFVFYNVTAGGLPWYVAVSTNKLNIFWTPWALLPWTVLIVGLLFLWRRATAADPTLRLFSLKQFSADSPCDLSPKI